MRIAIPHMRHHDEDGKNLYVDMYIEKYGTGELPLKYEEVLERFFHTKNKRVMLRKALSGKHVVILCPHTGKIEIMDRKTGEVVKRIGSQTLLKAARMTFDRDDDGYAEVSCRVRGDGLTSLLKILRHMQSIGGMGHSYSIELDPDDSDYRMSVGWDGDGSDHVKDIKVNGKTLDKKQFDKEAAIADRVTKRIVSEGREGRIAESVLHGVIEENS